MLPNVLPNGRKETTPSLTGEKVPMQEDMTKTGTSLESIRSNGIGRCAMTVVTPAQIAIIYCLLLLTLRNVWTLITL